MANPTKDKLLIEAIEAAVAAGMSGKVDFPAECTELIKSIVVDDDIRATYAATVMIASVAIQIDQRSRTALLHMERSANALERIAAALEITNVMQSDAPNQPRLPFGVLSGMRSDPA